MLRWWDGTRWTEHVQPARVAGKPVLGQEVTGGIGPVTFYASGRADHPRLPADHRRAVRGHRRWPSGRRARARAERTAATCRSRPSTRRRSRRCYQLRKGGVLGALAGVGEQLLVEAVAWPRRAGAVATGRTTPSRRRPGWPATGLDRTDRAGDADAARRVGLATGVGRSHGPRGRRPSRSAPRGRLRGGGRRRRRLVPARRGLVAGGAWSPVALPSVAARDAGRALAFAADRCVGVRAVAATGAVVDGRSPPGGASDLRVSQSFLARQGAADGSTVERNTHAPSPRRSS